MAHTWISSTGCVLLVRFVVLGVALWALSACRTSVPVAAVPEPSTAHLRSPDTWTTPRDWNEQPAVRLERNASTPAAPGLEVDAELGFFSKYVWRGQLFTDDPVLQPAVTLSYGDWSFIAWGNLELTDVNGDAAAFSEIDLLLEHTHDIGGATLLAGLGWYTFPSLTFPATFEVYAGITFDVPLNPRAVLYYDVDEVDGVYASLGVSEEVPLAAGSLLLEGVLGWGDNKWNQFSWGVPTEGFNDLLLRASWSWSSGRWRIKPSVAYSVLLDGDVRAAAASTDDWILGITAGLSL